MNPRTLISSLTLALAGFSACALPGRGDAPEPEVDTTQEVISDLSGDDSIDLSEVGEVDAAKPPTPFAGAVHDYLVANCTAAGCHGSGAGGYAITGDVEADYAAALREVTPGDAAASKLVKKASGVTSHTGGPILSEGTAEYDLIVAWINDGANP
jgi:hypothetical protein